MCAWAYFEVTLADLEINTVEFSGFSHFLCFVTSLHFILLKKNLCSKRKVKYRNIVLLELGTQKNSMLIKYIQVIKYIHAASVQERLCYIHFR